MKNPGATGTRKIPVQKPALKKGAGSSGVPFGGAVLLALCCAGGAYYVGDRAGYARGSAESLAAGPTDPIEKMDCMAKVHRAVTGPKADPVVVKPLPPPPVQPPDLTFHNQLKGGAPAKPLERPVDPLTQPGKTFVSAVPQAAPASSVDEKPEPKTPSAPGLTTAPATGEFALQVGAFPQKQDALKVYDRLKSAGLKPAIVPSELAGSTWYRVRVGRFADRAAADAGARALQSQVALSGVPVKH